MIKNCFETIKDFFEDCMPDLLSALAKILVIAVMASLYWAISPWVPLFGAADLARSNATAGVIVEKNINDTPSLLGSDSINYRIVIQYEYEHLGLTLTDKKTVSVDRDTYLEAEVGMYFDTQSLELKEGDPNNAQTD